jgi:hypothetical protein
VHLDKHSPHRVTVLLAKPGFFRDLHANFSSFRSCIFAGRSGSGATAYAIADRNADAFFYGDAHSITESETHIQPNAHGNAEKNSFAETHANSVAAAGGHADAVTGYIAQCVTNAAGLAHGVGSSESPKAPASPAPQPEPAQPGSPVTYPKPEYPDLLPRFDYDGRSGLEMRQTNIEKRGNTLLIELNYAGAGGDRVPAYLVLPKGNGPFAGIIWGHWLKKGSPLANKDEFLA